MSKYEEAVIIKKANQRIYNELSNCQIFVKDENNNLTFSNSISNDTKKLIIDTLTDYNKAKKLFSNFLKEKLESETNYACKEAQKEANEILNLLKN
jgi:hypothetical protein